MNMLDYCAKKAKELPYKRHQMRLYAVVLNKRGHIVSEASNSYIRTHAAQARAAKRIGLDEKVFCHAEALALIRDKKNKGCKLVVARVLSDGKFGNAKPCPVCEMMIKEHGGITSIEYSVGE